MKITLSPRVIMTSSWALMLCVVSLVCSSMSLKPACAEDLKERDKGTLESESAQTAESDDDSQSGLGGDFGGDMGGFGGFDDLPDVELKPADVPPPPSHLRVDGFARTQWAWWVERALEDGWAKGRQNLDLSARYKRSGWALTLEGHVEYDLLYLTDGPFDPVQKEEYQTQYIGGVQSLSKQLTIGDGSLTISTGRQIVTWGELDGFIVQNDGLMM